jgi:hypothetical protein
MLRLVERVLGEGEVHRDGVAVLRAGYELALYRKWTSAKGQLTPGHFEVEGFLMASPDALESLLGTASTLTLHLDDGRRFDCFVVNLDGALTPADDRGLYRA